MKNKDIRIGLLEDDLFMAQTIKAYLESDTQWKVQIYSNPSDIPEENLPDMMIFDYFIGNNKFQNNSEEALKRIKLRQADLPVIFFTSAKDIGIALEVLNKGAQDYIIKNEKNFPKLKNSILEVIQFQEHMQELKELREEIEKIKHKSLIYGGILLSILISTLLII